MKLLFIIGSFLMVYKVVLPTKARSVIFETEMATAKFIGQVVIEKYDTSGLFTFRSLEFKDTINTAQSHRLFNHFRYQAVDTSYFWTGRFPKIKDTVLLVIDSTYRISLCAKLIGKNYRFWDAHPSMSVAFFEFKPPAKILEDVSLQEKRHAEVDYDICWDGCLVSKDSISFYKNGWANGIKN